MTANRFDIGFQAIPVATLAAAAGEVALPSNVKDLQVCYFGKHGLGEDAAWAANWNTPDSLPQLVEIGVIVEDGDQRRRPGLLVKVQTGG
jgi:hypothetical protein